MVVVINDLTEDLDLVAGGTQTIDVNVTWHCTYADRILRLFGIRLVSVFRKIFHV